MPMLFALVFIGLGGYIVGKSYASNSPSPAGSYLCFDHTWSEAIDGGSKHQCVQDIQVMLDDTDHAGLARDGNFGSDTNAAVVAYQEKYLVGQYPKSCDQADGVIGSCTSNSLCYEDFAKGNGDYNDWWWNYGCNQDD